MTSSIAIIVVNYSSHALLAKNFAGAKLPANSHLFVVDNFTGNAELSALRELAKNEGWTVVPSSINVGFGAGVNLGASAALNRGFEHLMFVNPDVEIDGQTIQAMHEQVTLEPMTMVSPRIVTDSGKLWFDGGVVDLASGRVSTAKGADMHAPYAWLSGACLALSATLWAKSGGFDPEYFLYWEDVDFSQRVVRAGGELDVRNDLEVVHAVGGTQGEGKSAAYLRYNTRNRLLFASKWLPKSTVRRWVRHTPVESYRVLVRGGRRSLLRWSMVRAAVGGTAQGVWQARAVEAAGQQPHALSGARR